MADLARFLEAQARDYQNALAELRAGHKRSHWIWYVFPQLRGLGSSFMAEKYGLFDVAEARAYLADETLHARLAECVDVAYEHVCARGVSIETLMGSHIDALKLVSSLTLFAHVAAHVDDTLAKKANAILDKAAAHGFPRCTFTLAAIARAP